MCINSHTNISYVDKHYDRLTSFHLLNCENRSERMLLNISCLDAETCVKFHPNNAKLFALFSSPFHK